MDWLTYLPVATMFPLVLALFLLVRRVAGMEATIQQLEASRDGLQARLDAFDGKLTQAVIDAAAVRVSTVGLGSQLERLERNQGLLESYLGSMPRGGQQEVSYTQAIRQASRGHVGVQDLVQDFGLPRGEAELLLRMHRHASEEDALAQRMRKDKP